MMITKDFITYSIKILRQEKPFVIMEAGQVDSGDGAGLGVFTGTMLWGWPAAGDQEAVAAVALASRAARMSGIVAA